jgi:hypothetical protein
VPLELAFEQCCSDKGIDINGYYFLFKGVEPSSNMSTSQFQLRVCGEYPPARG